MVFLTAIGTHRNQKQKSLIFNVLNGGQGWIRTKSKPSLWNLVISNALKLKEHRFVGFCKTIEMSELFGTYISVTNPHCSPWYPRARNRYTCQSRL